MEEYDSCRCPEDGSPRWRRQRCSRSERAPRKSIERTVDPGDAGATAAASESAQAAEPVTITWYHIQNNDPGLSLWKKLADEYTAEHPNVTIDIQVNENEAFKTKLTTLLQQGDVPDLFQTWGGGGLRQQVEAGLVKDISADIASWKAEINPGALGMYEVDGKNYGVPFDLGLVGFWYNTKSFEDAGITAPPATWAEFLTDRPDPEGQGHHADRPGRQGHLDRRLLLGVPRGPQRRPGRDGEGSRHRGLDRSRLRQGWRRVQAADRPRARSRKASWPRRGTAPAAGRPRWRPSTAPCSSWASGSPAPSTPTRAAAGRWARASVGSRSRRSTARAGDPFDGLGGGNGFAVGKDAPPETVDFLHYLVSLDAANRWGALNSGILPTTVGSEASVTDPTMTSVLDGRAKAKFVQLYLDQATTPELGGAINEAVATLYAGTGTPETVAQAITRPPPPSSPS